MREANVYILNGTSLVKSLCKILETAVAKGARVHLLCENEVTAGEMDDMLWTYEQLSFLPHAKSNDPFPEKQPIIISAEEKVLSGAEVIALVSKKVPANINEFKKVLLVVDPNDFPVKEKTLEQVAELKNQGFNIRYFQQTPTGWSAVASL